MIVHSVERRGKQVGWPRVLLRFYLAFWVGILLWFVLRDVVPFEMSGFRSSFCLLGTDEWFGVPTDAFLLGNEIEDWVGFCRIGLVFVSTLAFRPKTHYSIGPASERAHCLIQTPIWPKTASYLKTIQELFRQEKVVSSLMSQVL